MRCDQAVAPRPRLHRTILPRRFPKVSGAQSPLLSPVRFGRRVQVIIRSSRSKIRSTVVMLAVAALAIAGMVTATASSAITEGSVMAAGAVEDDGASCPVTLPGSLTAVSKLPDPFMKLDGTRISAKSDWRCQRAEIKQLAQTFIYGAKPVKPASVTGTVSSTNITVNV